MRPYHHAAGITVHHGDCGRVLAALPVDSVDLVVTDPPWNMGLRYGTCRDDLPAERYDAWLAGIFTRCAEIGARRLVYLPGRHHLAGSDAVLRRSGLVRTAVLRWDRGADWEPVVVADRGEAPSAGRVVPATFCAPRPEPDAVSGHPCPKPLRLLAWLLRRCAWPGATVLDPFAGTGTTLVAARRAGHRAIGIEQEERFCAVAAARLEGLA